MDTSALSEDTPFFTSQEVAFAIVPHTQHAPKAATFQHQDCHAENHQDKRGQDMPTSQATCSRPSTDESETSSILMSSSSHLSNTPRGCTEQKGTLYQTTSCVDNDDIAAVSLQTGRRNYITVKELRASRQRLLDLIPADDADGLESDDSMTL
eukprot:jgi/Ulvmu1/817/UM010_0191.1